MKASEVRQAVMQLTDHIARAAQTGDQYVYAATYQAVMQDVAKLIPDEPVKPKLSDFDGTESTR